MYRTEWKDEELDRHVAAAKVIPFDVSFLDDALVGIFPNDLILLGALTGKGKTEFATNVALNASRRSKRVLFYALEADRWEIQRRMKYRALSQIYFAHYRGKFPWPRYSEWLVQGFMPDWAALEKEAENQLHLDMLELKVVYKGGKFTVNDFVKELADSAMHREFDFLVVDHLHYFDLDTRTETEGLKQAAHAMRNLSIHLGKPILLLAHLRKHGQAFPGLDDFHGHSDIVKVATQVIVMSPAYNLTQANDVGHFPTYFHIAKSRRASENVPYVGVLGFDRQRNRYGEKYYIAKHGGTDEPELITTASEIPEWYRRANRSFTYGHVKPAPCGARVVSAAKED